MTALGGYLVDAGPPAQAGMIVVLAGDHYGGRILKAAELVRQGVAPKVLVSGPENCCFGVYESELAIAFAVRHGYPDSYFVSLDESRAVDARRSGIHHRRASEAKRSSN